MRSKKLVSLVLVGMLVLATLSMAGCSNKESDGSSVEVYTTESMMNSDVINVWKSLYLLNEDTYLFTVYSVDSHDTSQVTADFFMKGNYTREGETVTIDLGYGYVKALNGGTPVEMSVSPEGSAMYYAMVGGQYTSFTLLEDGSFDIAD